MSEYNPHQIEARWQTYWDEHQTFRTGEDYSRPKFYALDMFPYPSGAGLHVGHPEGYTATDILSRYKRMRGFNVLHPMGWDAFGLPAERAAMREGIHPAILTRQYVDNFRRQIKRLGFSYDWDREIDTTDPKYYRWTQWIFLKLYERGLAYRAEVPVNWCPAQGTVLSNEEVEDGKYIETGEPVERRMMLQWQLKITLYAERLLQDLEEVDWPHSIKEMQRNWIGKSTGAEVRFALPGHDDHIKVFTTRPDTLFGATYMVLAPEHRLVSQLTTPEQAAAVGAYVAEARNRSDRDRTDGSRAKTGVFTGSYAVNPVNGVQIPIWLSDYVLASYGTGAIMAVPAHDERDWAFAKQFDLPIQEVVSGGDVAQAAYPGDGVLVNSGMLDGKSVADAKAAITAWLEANKLGEGQTNYRLRDWLFSRQRYWGEPFPLILLDDGSVKPVAESELPVTLPHVEEFRPTADGRPPLARAQDWVQTTDPATGRRAERETNTMPQWAGSCWYYLRFIDPHNEQLAIDPEKERYWMPVDLYVGGAEHAVLHLLYARFWHKVLYDAGVVSTREPFQRLFNQGMILAFSYRDARGKYFHPSAVNEPLGDQPTADGIPVTRMVEKMSKSKYNVVNPDDIIAEYGADSLRLYEMYMGPLEATKPWQTDGVRGMFRFLARAWRLGFGEDGAPSPRVQDVDPCEETERLLHQTTRKVGEDIEGMRFNTGIAALIELVNHLTPLPVVPKTALERLALLLSPFAPHLGEELWASLGHSTSLALEPWPTYDEARLQSTQATIAVQILGKTRATIDVPVDCDEETAVAAAVGHERVAPHLADKTVVKRIWVPGRILNFIVR